MESSSMSNKENLIDFQKIEKNLVRGILRDLRSLYNYTNFNKKLIKEVNLKFQYGCSFSTENYSINDLLKHIIDNVFEIKTIRFLIKSFSEYVDLDIYKYLLNKFPSVKFYWKEIIESNWDYRDEILNYILDNGLENRFSTKFPLYYILKSEDQIPFELIEKILSKDFHINATQLRNFTNEKSSSIMNEDYVMFSKVMSLIYDKKREIFHIENKFGKSALSKWKKIWVRDMSECINA